MKKLLQGLLAVGLVAVLAGALPAQEKKGRGKRPRGEPYAGVFAFKKITLSDKQKEQVDALKKEYVPKLTEVDKKKRVILTSDRVKAAIAAQKKAKSDGTTNKKELNKVYNDALKLSEDEAKQLAELNRSGGALVKEINKKKMDLLTEEQKAALKPKPRKPKDS
jgi:hypothetical protein